MNERAIEIINLIIRNEDYKVTDIERELGLTRRQINYALNQMNELLGSNGLPTIKRNSVGQFYIPTEVVQMFAADTTEILMKNKYYFDVERFDYIMLYLAVYAEEVSLNHLIDTLKVSKNTIISDLKNVERILEKYEIKLEYSRIKGYIIAGVEKAIRKMLNDVIRRNILLKREVPFSKHIKNLYGDKSIHLIRNLEKKMDIRYSDESFNFLIEALSYNFARIESGKSYQLLIDEGNLKDSVEYKVLKGSLNISIHEELYIALLFITSNVYTNNLTYGQAKEDDYVQKIMGLIKRMVSMFEQKTLIQIEDRDKFEVRLLNHLRPAIYRIRFNLKINDYSLQALRQEDGELIQLMTELVQPIEEFIGKQIPDDELKLLSLYFGMQLSTNDKLPEPKKRAVVVCSNGLIVSKLMLEILKNLFPELRILTSLSVREFSEFESDYDLVFSTMPLETKIKQYVINPMMSQAEQLKLRQRVLSDYGILEIDEIVSQMIKIIKNHGKISEPDNLKDKLELLLVSKLHGNVSQEEVCPPLGYYLQESDIQIIDYEITWEEAILLAFQPLLKREVVTIGYVDETIAQFNEVENFAYFGTAMAIPHCDVVEEITAENIGILISKVPIKFPKMERIYIISAIAIIDTTRHLRAIKQLANIAQDEERVDLLVSSTTTQEVYRKMLMEAKS